MESWYPLLSLHQRFSSIQTPYSPVCPTNFIPPISLHEVCRRSDGTEKPTFLLHSLVGIKKMSVSCPIGGLVLIISIWKRIEKLLCEVVDDIYGRRARQLSTIMRLILVLNVLLEFREKSLKQALTNKEEKVA